MTKQRLSETDLKILAELEKKILWLSSWTIHHANHLRDSGDGLKVGGHQASSASLATIMTALYFHALRPQDRVAVKPHASPNLHAIQYLRGRQSQDKLENFRGYKGAQSYPSRTKDADDVDFSTGSVGLGVAQTLFGGSDLDRWEAWWYFQRESYLPRHAAGRQAMAAGRTGLPDGRTAGALSPARIDSPLLPADARARVLPVLVAALKDKSTEVVDAAAIALGRSVETTTSGPFLLPLTRTLAHFEAL